MEIKEITFVHHLESEQDNKWHGREHKHSDGEYEVHYFVSGQGEFENGSVRSKVTKRRLFITKPNVKHSVIPQNNKFPITYYAILFNLGEDDLKSLMLSTVIGQEYFVLPSDNRYFFESLRNRLNMKNKNLRLAAEHIFLSFLYDLVENNKLHLDSDYKKIYIEQALEVMHENIYKNIELKEIANIIGISESHFIRIFTEVMGMSPIQFYLFLKVEVAQSLLKRSNMQIQDIANKLSFYDQFHFSKLFKDKLGLSPSQYRKMYEYKD